MINKELLSEVLKYPMEVTTNVTYYISIISEPYFLDGNKTEVYFNTDNVGSGVCKINIYELAHKCKEWAWSQKIQPNSLNHYTYKSSLSCLQTADNTFLARVSDRGECKTVFHCESRTEPEAIFKACQWILENK